MADLTPEELERQKRLQEALGGAADSMAHNSGAPSSAPLSGAIAGPSEEMQKKKRQMREDGGVHQNVLESVKPGTLTALGSMAGPYGTAAGAAADIGLAIYQENRKVKRENAKRKEAMQVQGWNMMDRAAGQSNQREQVALKQLMGVGS